MKKQKWLYIDKWYIFPFLILFLLCTQQCSSLQAPEDYEGLYSLTIKGVELEVEVAVSSKDKNKGLMYREKLPENQGMLFVYNTERPLSLWMKNTEIPLSAAFIDSDGIILNIRKMKPFDTDTSYKSAAPACYIIEVNQGWFSKNNIGSGDKVKFSDELKSLLN